MKTASLKITIPLLCYLLGAMPISADANTTKGEQLKLSNRITVSGVSSGGYMANQLHIAHSEQVSGAGIIAAGPYYCAQGNLASAIQQCLANGETMANSNPQDLFDKASQTGSLADTKNLQADRVWLFHGNLDKRVARTVTDSLYRQYRTWMDESNIQYVNDMASNHGMPTQDFGAPCTESTTPFINDCDYDAAGELLSWLHPGHSTTENNEGKLYRVQQPQAMSKHPTFLDKQAYLFVPDNCQANKQCDLHISFHGCQQNSASVGTDYVLNAGFNSHAAKLGLAILYPQVASGNPMNPLACWDWWGYSGKGYATQNGVQISAVMQVVKALQENKLPLQPMQTKE